MEILILFPLHSSTKYKFKLISDVVTCQLVSFIPNALSRKNLLSALILQIFIFLIIYSRKPSSNYSKIYYFITSPCDISPSLLPSWNIHFKLLFNNFFIETYFGCFHGINNPLWYFLLLRVVVPEEFTAFKKGDNCLNKILKNFIY